MRDQSLYIPLHTGIRTSRKTLSLMRALKAPRREVLGSLSLLWLAIVDQAPDGILEGWDVETIADSAEWPLEQAGAFVDALVRAGFLVCADGIYRAASWEDYAGKTLTKRVTKTQQRRAQRKPEAPVSPTVANDDGDKRRHDGDNGRQAATSGDNAATSPTIAATTPNVAPEPVLDLDLEPVSLPLEERAAAPQAPPPAPPPTAQPKKPKAPKPHRPDFATLLAMPYKGHETAEAFFRATYAAWDGRNGRLSLDDKLEGLASWQHAAKSKAWREPSGPHRALARDYPAVLRAWEIERERAARPAGTPPWQAPQPTEEQTRRDDELRRRKIAEQQAKFDVTVTDDDREAGLSMLSLMKAQVTTKPRTLTVPAAARELLAEARDGPPDDFDDVDLPDFGGAS